MRELSLFTGAGGGVLGGKLLGWETVGYVEIDGYCQKVIAQRIKDGLFDEAPVFGDICQFLKSGAARQYRGFVDVVTAGFPCQDISIVGRGGGIQGEKSGLWRETAAVIRQVGPSRVLLENSPALTYRGLGDVLRDLAGMGFDARWGVLSGQQFGAPHIRERIWIVADADGFRWDGLEENQERRRASEYQSIFGAWRDIQADLRIPVETIFHNPGGGVLRNDDGLAVGMDRLQAIGNGQIPVVVKGAWELLSGMPSINKSREGL